MKTGFVQFRPIFGDIEGNVRQMESLIAPLEADLLVLPELANSGYAFTSKEELASLAEPFDNSPSLDRLQALAAEKNCSMVAGFAEKEGGRLYNSSALLRPDGSRELYRKIHLFGAENRFFTPGDIPFEVHETDAARIGMMICFDWFYPESARVLALKGAQVICHAVNFVLPWGQRGAVFASLWNRVFMVTANRYGTENRGEFSFTFTGGSQITAPTSDILASAPVDSDAAVVIEIDPKQADNKKINKYNDLLAGRKTDYYKDIIDL